MRSRSAELEALSSEVNTLTGRLADVASAKERADNVLQQELEKKTALLQLNDAASKELETNLGERVHALENQLSEKTTFLNDRDAELDSLRGQLMKTGSAKDEIESRLRDELTKTMEVLGAKDFTIRELEESFNKTVDALEESGK